MSEKLESIKSAILYRDSAVRLAGLFRNMSSFEDGVINYEFGEILFELEFMAMCMNSGIFGDGVFAMAKAHVIELSEGFAGSSAKREIEKSFSGPETFCNLRIACEINGRPDLAALWTNKKRRGSNE